MKATLRASQRQDTNAGNFLMFLFFKTQVFDIIKGNFTGFPCDGGSHSLTFHIDNDFTFKDVEAFLAIIDESYGYVNGCLDFIFDVRERMVDLKKRLGLHKE